MSKAFERIFSGDDENRIKILRVRKYSVETSAIKRPDLDAMKPLMRVNFAKLLHHP